MKKTTLRSALALAALTLAAFAPCSMAEPTPEAGKVLIVYFSRVGNTDFSTVTDTDTHASVIAANDGIRGNTEVIARMIQNAVGGDLHLIKTEKIYPTAYRATTDEGQKEARANVRPPLASKIDISSYDTVFLGYPNWWGDMPMALYTFLEEYDLSGKTIVPFVTSGGSGFSRTQKTIAEKARGAKVLKGLHVRDRSVANSQNDVEKWLKGLGLAK